DLAVFELADDDTGDVRLLAGGGDVAERAAVRSLRAQMLHDVVALGDLALDGELGVRERRAVDAHGLPRALGAAAEVRLRRVVADGVLGERLVDELQVLLVEALLHEAAYGELVLVSGGHGAPLLLC